MARDYSAVQVDAADSQVASGQEAHDMLQIHGQGRETIRGSPEVIKTSRSLDLESPSAIKETPSSPRGIDVNLPTLADSSHDVLATGNQKESSVTTTPHDTTKGELGRVNGNHAPDQAAPFSTSIVPLSRLPRDITAPATPPPTATNETAVKTSVSAAALQAESGNAVSNTISSQQTLQGDEAGSANIPHKRNMLFSYRAPGPATTAAHRRRQYANTSALTDYEADLTGKDRAKQKEAVRKLLMEKIRDDWKWVWPRPQPDLDAKLQADTERQSKPEIEPDVEPEDESALSPVQAVETRESQLGSGGEEHVEQWKERDEWLSNASDSGEDAAGLVRKAEKSQPATKDNPFRFETPDGIGDTVKKTLSERKRRRKKRLAEEMACNDGVRCFMERRDAWTGARRVSRSSPTKQLRKSTSHSSQDGGSSTAMDPEPDADEDVDWEADTEIPVAPPLIPHENAMRASITPTAYNTIYDKVILQNLNPSCPINLKDITRSCVQGWKRDGEWPPKSSVPDTLAGRRRRKSLASLFGLEKTKSKEDREKAEKEPVENNAPKDSEHKPGAFKKFTRKFRLLGKDKDHEHSKEHGEIGNGSNGKRKESGAGVPVT